MDTAAASSGKGAGRCGFTGLNAFVTRTGAEISQAAEREVPKVGPAPGTALEEPEEVSASANPAARDPGAGKLAGFEWVRAVRQSMRAETR